MQANRTALGAGSQFKVGRCRGVGLLSEFRLKNVELIRQEAPAIKGGVSDGNPTSRPAFQSGSLMALLLSATFLPDLSTGTFATPSRRARFSFSLILVTSDGPDIRSLLPRRSCRGLTSI